MRRLLAVGGCVVVLSAWADDSFSAAVTESERVVHARIRSVESFEGTVNGAPGIYTRVDAEVMEAYRGPATASVGFMLVGGVVGDRAVIASHQPWFVTGEEVVIFLFRGGDVLFPLSELGKWKLSAPGIDRTAASAALKMPLLKLRDRVGRLSSGEKQ